MGVFFLKLGITLAGLGLFIFFLCLVIMLWELQ